MQNNMKNLIKEIKKYQDIELEDSVYDKIDGEAIPGSNVEIHWVDRDEIDEGYIFTLPDQQWDEYDACVHIPSPDNSDGIDDAPEVHIHLLKLASFDRVEKIIIL